MEMVRGNTHIKDLISHKAALLPARTPYVWLGRSALSWLSSPTTSPPHRCVSFGCP